MKIWTMNPWSLNELHAAYVFAFFIYMLSGISSCSFSITLQDYYRPGTFNRDRSDHMYFKYGGIARCVFDGYSDDVHDSEDGRVEDEIEQTSLEKLKALISLSKANMQTQISHKIFATWRDENKKPYGTSVSQFVTLLIMRTVAFKTLAENHQSCRLLAGIPHANVARRWCFEPFVHAILTKPVEAGVVIRITPLSSRDNHGTYTPDSSLSHVQYPRAYRELNIYESAKDFALKRAVPEKYYIPKASNKPCFDAFIILDKVAWIFRMTFSTTHRIDTPKRNDLDLLEDILPTGLDWCYVLVTPKGVTGP